MRNLTFILVMVFGLYSSQAFSQSNKDSSYLTKKDLIGTWQRNYDRVGNGLFENFQFFQDNTFLLDLSGNDDDARELLKLKGKFRLDKDKLYFTITSKIVAQGKIEMVDPGVNFGIFAFDDSVVKEIKEDNPKELADPCFITVLSKNKIKLNSELYFKVK
jgi:hypothetical protein